MMRIDKTMTGVALALALMLGGGVAMAAGTDAKAADPKAAEAAKVIEHAEMARKRAASVDGEWRDTAKFIKKARALAKEGKYDAAIKLAKKAKRQGELGYEQAVSQEKLRIPSYFQSYYSD
ncbi:MAG TPA: SoxXA-binding protein [Sedimenticola thiotaurini]|uniref:SoxXA-binding protein n=1 Tax=Sedimenticola thiotaurini TaxID=1543721 RepID=A0A831WBD3_9GAMM|nr:SoxXA-binding protein [Sedimenticola thiotaurini]